jgi:hypothetical protein
MVGFCDLLGTPNEPVSKYLLLRGFDIFSSAAPTALNSPKLKIHI